MYMVLFVLHDPDKLNALLDAWEAIGLPGVTIMHSTGLGRLRSDASLWDDMPLFPGLDDFYEHEEYFSRTLFAVLPESIQPEQVLEATQEVIGDLNLPDRGLMVVLPLAKVYGLRPKPDSE
jgi:nitrogen regulatory protein PII